MHWPFSHDWPLLQSEELQHCVGQEQVLPLFWYGSRQSKSHSPSELHFVVPFVTVEQGVHASDW